MNKKIVSFTGTEFQYPMSPSLAYVVGAVLADGCVFKSTAYIVRLDVMDKDFAETFCKCLKEVTTEYSPCLYQSKRGTWIAAVGSKKLYLAMKGFKLEWILEGEEKEKQASMFLRGFFDGEGTVYASEPRAIYAYNTDYELMLFVQKCLSVVGIYTNIHKKTDNRVNRSLCYILGIYGRENIQKYHNKVGFSIQRKQERLDKLIKSYVTRQYNPQIYFKVMELSKQGLSVSEISKEVHLSHQRVFGWTKVGEIPSVVKNQFRS